MFSTDKEESCWQLGDFTENRHQVTHTCSLLSRLENEFEAIVGCSGMRDAYPQFQIQFMIAKRHFAATLGGEWR